MRTRLLLLFVAFLSWAGMSNAQNEDKDKPLLTLACISDIHTERSLIENIDDIALRGSFTRTISIIKRDEKIDAMLLGGDCTSDATIPYANWEKVRTLIAKRSRLAFPSTTSTPVLYVTGNHDYEVANWDNIPKPYNAGDYYSYPMKQDIGELAESEAFYEDADNGELGTMTLLAAYHYVINGFDFVILNCGKNFFQNAWNYVYSEESVKWVADKLAEIYDGHPDKVVFFALHVPFADSNSIREPSKGMASSPGEKLLKQTLSKYPNLIMLYGHDHGGDKAYTRVKTSQRVTRYNTTGQVIATTDDTHVDVMPEGVEDEDATDKVNINLYIQSAASGQYIGFNSINLGMVADPTLVTTEVTDADNSTFSVKVSGSASEANGNYIISSSSGRFSANANTYPTYFYKVIEENATNIKAEKTSKLEEGESYLIVAENAKDRTKLYALTNEGYPATNSNRLVGLLVEPVDGIITISASQTNALWKLQVAKTETEGDPSFFSAFMGSMRYYYNTIDPGDMPVETPNIVQALMVYVYPDRVELHMKNYNRSGTINGITVNKNLAPYISYRKVEIPEPTAIQGTFLKDMHVETAEIYDLSGRKVSHATKGLYITKGQKVIVK